jgi:hypothetical protein
MNRPNLEEPINLDLTVRRMSDSDFTVRPEGAKGISLSLKKIERNNPHEELPAPLAIVRYLQQNNPFQGSERPTRDVWRKIGQVTAVSAKHFQAEEILA